MPTTGHILVIGFGNTLRGDDALGRIACQRLREHIDANRVTVIDQTAPTPELAVDVAKASLVIFLDASEDGPVDQIVTRVVDVSEVATVMAHRLGPSEILALAAHLYESSPPAYVISFQGKTFELSDNQLTAEADVACRQIVQCALELIDARI